MTTQTGPALPTIRPVLVPRSSCCMVAARIVASGMTMAVARLREQFNVLTIDLRGNGERDKPIDADAYAINRLTDDVLAVAEAADAKQFAVWGYSYGANVGRYLPSRSDRVTRLVIIGIGFGAAATDSFRNYALNLSSKWQPVIEAWRAGSLDVSSLSDQAWWEKGQIPTGWA